MKINKEYSQVLRSGHAIYKHTFSTEHESGIISGVCLLIATGVVLIGIIIAILK